MAGPSQFTEGIRYLKFNKTDADGRDNSITLKNVEKIRMTVNSGSFAIDLNVVNITALADSVLVEVTPYEINSTYLEDQENFYFSPYLPEDFFRSDYNALLNNALDSERSEIYFEADYSVSQITASNLPAVLSQSAQLAEFNDYNLNIQSYTNPRYNGSRLQAAELNKYTKGDVSYGGEPVINYTDTYFAYFDWIGGTAPERNDTVTAHISYLVDREGKVLEPSVSNNAFYNMLNTFEDKDLVEVVLDDPEAFSTNMSILNGMKEVVRAGVKIEPIIYSQTGSELGSRASYITFGDNETVAQDFRALVAYSGSATFILPGETKTIWFNDEIYDNSNAYTGGFYGEYKVPSNSEALIQFIGGIQLIRKESLNHRVDYRVVLQVSQSDSGWYGHTELYDTIPIGDFEPRKVFINSGQIAAISESRYRVRVECFTNGLYVTTGSYFQVSQSIAPNFTASAPYWISGSAVYSQSFYYVSDDYIVAQGILKNGLGTNQVDIAGSGFNTLNYPFTIQPGDEIRFEGQEPKAHLVMEVYNPQDRFTDYTVGIPPPFGDYGKDLSSGYLIVKLQPSVYPNTNLDNFVIRRYVEDRSYIIFKSNKPSGQTSAGLIKPEYLSKDIVDNFDQINRNFRSQNLRTQ